MSWIILFKLFLKFGTEEIKTIFLNNIPVVELVKWDVSSADIFLEFQSTLTLVVLSLRRGL